MNPQLKLSKYIVLYHDNCHTMIELSIGLAGYISLVARLRSA
jgi:Fe-S oxidoreductase